jgi:hypothetical protein
VAVERVVNEGQQVCERRQYRNRFGAGKSLAQLIHFTPYALSALEQETAK